MSYLQYQAYKTHRLAPRSVKYWDRMYREKSYFYDWQIVVGIVDGFIPEIQAEVNVTKNEARKLAWNAYAAAIVGDEESPFFDVYNDFCDEIPPKEIPEFVMTQTVGVDINNGIPEKKAVEEFQAWLREDQNNGLFGDYMMLSNLSVKRVKRTKRKKR